MSEHDTVPEVLAVAFLCGSRRGSLYFADVFDVMASCLSHGEVGWGLALFLLNVVASGGNVAPTATSVIPFGGISRVKAIHVMDENFTKEIIERESIPSLVVKREEKVEEKVVKSETLPMAFSVYLSYVDYSGRENKRVLVVAKTNHTQTPYTVFVCSDSTVAYVEKRLREEGYPPVLRKKAEEKAVVKEFVSQAVVVPVIPSQGVEGGDEGEEGDESFDEGEGEDQV